MASPSDAENRLFITKIPQSVDKSDVHVHFGTFGKLTDVYMPSVPGQAGHKGTAFVSFADAQSLNDAMSNCPHELHGREVVVDIAAPRASQRGGQSQSNPFCTGGTSNPTPRASRGSGEAFNMGSSGYQQSALDVEQESFLAIPGTQDDRLFVSKVPQELTRDHLRAHFAQFGDLTDIYMPAVPGQNSHKGMCFVSFAHNNSVKLALGHGIHEVLGHKVVVDMAAPRAAQSGAQSASHSDGMSAGMTMAQYSAMAGMGSYGAMNPYAAMQAMYNPAAMQAYAQATTGAQVGGAPSLSPAAGTTGTPIQGRLFVTRVPPEVNKEDLQAYFSQFGTLTDCFVPNGGKGIAFVSFHDPSSAERVLTNRRHTVKSGRDVYVEQALDRPPLGGKGGGGKGDGGSSQLALSAASSSASMGAMSSMGAMGMAGMSPMMGMYGMYGSGYGGYGGYTGYPAGYVNAMAQMGTAAQMGTQSQSGRSRPY